MSNKIFLCAISNIKSGVCNEDCKFCTQSSKYKADIQRYKQKDIDQILKEAKIARANKAVGFCLVTAGKGLDDKTLEFVCKSAKAVKKEVPDLHLIGCNGLASLEQLKELKSAGVDHYNHNLESSKEFYNQICSTHSWEDRFQTCLNAKDAGLMLCSGAIFGMGESEPGRESILRSLKELEPISIPLNFFHPNSALPIQSKPMDKSEAFEIIKRVRDKFPKAMIMVAGGREITFGSSQYEVFKYGANSVVIGDYLTTSGEQAKKDIQEIQNCGYEISLECDF
jgi:biotin synthase